MTAWKKMGENEYVCGKCGNKVTAGSYNELTLNHKFCGKCGTRIKLVIPSEHEWAEVKRGRWINVNGVLKCSACGKPDNRMYRTDSYCPNCGAKMEDEE